MFSAPPSSSSSPSFVGSGVKSSSSSPLSVGSPSSVSSPSKKEVEDFYYANESQLFTNKTTGEPFGLVSSYGSVEAILLKEKQELKKDSFFNSLKALVDLILEYTSLSA